MSTIDLTMNLLHTVFAGLWAGAAVFVAALVVPAARDGRLGAEALDWFTQQYTRFSSLAALVLFATGGHLAGSKYEFSYLLESSTGHLILTMVGLWFLLIGLTHAGRSKLADGLSRSARDAADDAATFFYAAGAVAVALLLVAGQL